MLGPLLHELAEIATDIGRCDRNPRSKPQTYLPTAWVLLPPVLSPRGELLGDDERRPATQPSPAVPTGRSRQRHQILLPMVLMTPLGRKSALQRSHHLWTDGDELCSSESRPSRAAACAYSTAPRSIRKSAIASPHSSS